MCRIAGIFDPSVKNLAGEILSMRDVMHRGGPDDEGVFIDDEQPLAFGHRRLSLIDLTSNGHQPMSDLGGDLQIVFNGEIYNYQELRTILKNYGYNFATASDTEVILKAYQKWGVEGFNYFDGMFALAIWDKRIQQLILARDHAGIKPLYYYIDNKKCYFASEVKAFNNVTKQFEEDNTWKTYFLAFGYLPEPVTTLQNVQPLASGTALIIDIPSLEKKEYKFYKLSFTEDIKFVSDAVQLVKEKLQLAVKGHLISDAPVGLFLSGGIDSSLLTIIANKIHGRQLHTLSIVFEEEEFSEQQFQDVIIKKTNVHHQSFLVTKQDFYESLPDIFKAMDQPTIDGINTYFISQYARQYGLKAVLSGLGADELFGGYPSFKLSAKFALLKRMPSSLLNSFQHTGDYRFRKLSFASLKNNIGEYLVYRGIFPPAIIAKLSGSYEREVNENLNKLAAFYPEQYLKNDNQISWLETVFYMQSQLLKDTDFMSMWHGIEIRVPFLDKILMSVITQAHPSVKFRKDFPKYLLVKAFENDLPEVIWKRKKQGFTFPFSKWLKQSDIIQPVNDTESKMLSLFHNDKLSWGRYWSVVLMNRFSTNPSYVSA